MTKNYTLEIEKYFIENPGVFQTYSKNLTNRRALTKEICNKKNIPMSKFEAVNTALRRFPYKSPTVNKISLQKIEISSKNNITIIYVEKNEENSKRISQFSSSIKPHETLKIIQGTNSIKIIIDEKKSNELIKKIGERQIIRKIKKCAEITIGVPEKIPELKGIIAAVTGELSISNITIIELNTGFPELMIYVENQNQISTLQALERLTNV